MSSDVGGYFPYFVVFIILFIVLAFFGINRLSRNIMKKSAKEISDYLGEQKK